VDAVRRASRAGRRRLRGRLRGDGARPDGLTRITVTVSPGAARSELVGRHGDGWRARVAAPPERGKANEALVALLADLLGVTKARIRVVAGQTARRKIVEIDGLDAAEVAERLGEAD
jgi:uncharacterized protein